MPPKRALRRPAARVRGIRRPAALAAAEVERAADEQGRALHSLTLQELQGLGAVYLSDARYYGRLVLVAGRMNGTRLEEGQMFAELAVTGTKDVRSASHGILSSTISPSWWSWPTQCGSGWMLI